MYLSHHLHQFAIFFLFVEKNVEHGLKEVTQRISLSIALAYKTLLNFTGIELKKYDTKKKCLIVRKTIPKIESQSNSHGGC